MAQKNETPTAILALLLTVGLLGLGLWWLTRQTGFRVQQLVQQTETSSTFASVQKVPSGVFNYGGSTTWAPLRGQVDPVIQQAFPNFQLRYTDPPTGVPGSGSGIGMLLEDQLAIAQSSRPLEDKEYQRAKDRGFTLKQIPVALEGIAIIVHPTLNIPGLTLDQLKGIYTGQIRNWSQVGGSDRPIVPYSRQLEAGGTVKFFDDNVMNGQPFGKSVQFVSNTTQAIRQISTNPDGLYYASAPEVIQQCTVKPLPIGRTPDKLIPPYAPPFIPSTQCPERRNQINRKALQNGEYPLTRLLFVIVKQDGQLDQQAGEAYAQLLLTNQGQDLINKAGFVRIR